MLCGGLPLISAKLGCGKSKTDSPVHSSSSNSNSGNNKMAGKSGNNLLFPAANSQQRLSSSSPQARNKVALKPGRSLMDWIRLGRSGQDLTGVGGRTLSVTKEELAKHNTLEDAWIAIRGKVYNISPYLEYHPGGVDELMRGAGIDGTQLFDEIHKWVNAESMLEKCYVGKLEMDSPDSKGGGSRKGSNKSLSLGPNGAISIAALKPPEPQTPTYDWFQSSKVVTIAVYTRWKMIHADHVTIDKTNKTLRIAVSIEKCTFKIHLELNEDVTTEYTVKAHPETGKVEIILPKSEPEKHWPSIGKSLRGDNSYIKTFQAETVYRECSVESLCAVTHDVMLLAIVPPDGCRVPVPVGHHVQIKHKATGMEIARSYTAVLPSLEKDKQDARQDQGRLLYLMIKIYPDGAVTPYIGTLSAGDQVSLSDSDGSFHLSRLNGVSHLTMFAAGTGFTPMIRLIYHTIVRDENSHMQVHLVFYNKKICDIMWREQLDALAEQYSRFKVTYILSDEPSWDGLKGRICMDHVKEFVPLPNQSGETSLSCIPPAAKNTELVVKLLVCVCGPTPYTNTATMLLKEHGLSNSQLYLFQG